MATNKPIETIRDGNLKVVFWENQGENGPFVNSVVSKVYKDAEGNYRETHSMSGTDHLRAAELHKIAYHKDRELQREYYQSNERDGEPERERSRAGRQFQRSQRPARTR
ncbi:MAG: hypothetical protein AAGH41_02665 [Pseudomonadota bacterium]